MSTIFWQESDRSTGGELVLACPRCECPLALHQPDPELSDRLLATCDECKSWFLADSQGTALVPLCDSKHDDDQANLAW